jgi:UDP-glucose 4-epimerase
MDRVCITGGCGFIGSNLADHLTRQGVEVRIIDDLRTGRRAFVADALDRPGCRLIEADVFDRPSLLEAVAGCDWVFHLQANADVRHGLEHPTLDTEQNILATQAVLEAMRETGVTRIAFSSTGSIYGEPAVFPTPEDAPFPVQTSLYGASKLAAEGLIAAYAAGFAMTGVIFRFVSIMGERYTHGHVIDFYRALRKDSSVLHVLGNGKQTKSYLYVGDCIQAMTTAVRHHEGSPGAYIYNLGTDETLTVDDSVSVITAHLGVSPTIVYGGGERGWVGDSPLIQVDTGRIRALGWRPELTIRQALRRTLSWFDENSWLWEAAPDAGPGAGPGTGPGAAPDHPAGILG